MATHASPSSRTAPTARVRIDKWLWAARFFKTRSLAAEACDRAHVRLNGTPVKPARDVQAGDWLVIENPGGVYEIQIVAISDVRGPAKVAQALYAETPASLAQRQREAERRRLQPEPEAQRQGRPTKRERRDIDRFRGNGDW